MKEAIKNVKRFLIEHYSKVLGGMIIGYLAIFWKQYQWMLGYSVIINLAFFIALIVVLFGGNVYFVLKIKTLIKQEQIEEKQERDKKQEEANDIDKKKQTIISLQKIDLKQCNYYQLLDIGNEIPVSSTNVYGVITADSFNELIQYLGEYNNNMTVEQLMNPVLQGLVEKTQSDFNYLLKEELEILGGK